jgi:hypothetical protein
VDLDQQPLKINGPCMYYLSPTPNAQTMLDNNPIPAAILCLYERMPDLCTVKKQDFQHNIYLQKSLRSIFFVTGGIMNSFLQIVA